MWFVIYMVGAMWLLVFAVAGVVVPTLWVHQAAPEAWRTALTIAVGVTSVGFSGGMCFLLMNRLAAWAVRKG